MEIGVRSGINLIAGACFLLACPVKKIPSFTIYICSNKVSVLDMAVPVVEELIELENGVVMYDALLQREVLVIAPVLAVLSDNPRHSELLNRSGESAKKFCRMCMVCTCIIHTSASLALP